VQERDRGPGHVSRLRESEAGRSAETSDPGIAALPSNEAARLRTLHEYRILDSGRDARFEELATEVATDCATPIATITFVDAERQWFKASVGIPFEQTDREAAFCAHTILDPERVLVVEDATKDPRFANNPMVIGEPRLVAYAGAPMVAPDGTVIGTVCAMDYEPRAYTSQQLGVLRRVAAQVVELLDATSAAERLVDGDAHAPTAAGPTGAPQAADDRSGRDGSPDDVLALTRPLIEAIGEEVEIVDVLERFCAEAIETFGWWAARISWVQGDTLRPGPWQLAPAAPPVLAHLAERVPGPVELDDLSLEYREPLVHDVGTLRWFDDRDLVAGVGGRHAVVLDVPGSTSLAARLVFLLPSTRALTAGAARTLLTAAAVLPRVFVQDRARRELTYRATHDVLTGLLNREGLVRRYAEVIGDRSVDRAVLYIDVDGFKAVNDRLGHRAGDEVLTQVGRRISASIRPTDTAARIGGDEFVVVLDGIAHEDEALRVARRLLEALCGTCTLFHIERVDLTVSIGVAMWGSGLGLAAAVEAADGLMYAAKELGGASVGLDGSRGRRLLGAADDDERDLDAVLSGAMRVVVAPVRDASGRLRAIRAEVGVELRHPVVDDLVGLVLHGVRPLLAQVQPEIEAEARSCAPVELFVAPAGLLWGTDGLVLRLLVALSAALGDVPLRLVLSAEDGHGAPLDQALVIRDALGVGLVVGGFGRLHADLGLVDRIAPVALELAPDVLAGVTSDAPPSALIAAEALAARRGLVLLVPVTDGRPPDVVLGELSVDGSCPLLLVDLAAAAAHRRQPQRHVGPHSDLRTEALPEPEPEGGTR